MTLPDPVPEATIERLPSYLRALDDLLAHGRSTASSQELADAAGIQPALLRRDLSHFGSLGTRGVGYDLTTLRAELGHHVGTEESWPLVIVGAGNLGSALARQFSRPPFRVVAIVDSDERLHGQRRGGVLVSPQRELGRLVAQTGAVIGVIAVTAEAAQDVCDGLVAAGLHSLLSFAPVGLHVPADVHLRRVDLAQELSVLAYHESHRRTEGHPGDQRPEAVR